MTLDDIDYGTSISRVPAAVAVADSGSRMPDMTTRLMQSEDPNESLELLKVIRLIDFASGEGHVQHVYIIFKAKRSHDLNLEMKLPSGARCRLQYASTCIHVYVAAISGQNLLREHCQQVTDACHASHLKSDRALCTTKW